VANKVRLFVRRADGLRQSGNPFFYSRVRRIGKFRDDDLEALLFELAFNHGNQASPG